MSLEERRRYGSVLTAAVHLLDRHWPMRTRRINKAVPVSQIAGFRRAQVYLAGSRRHARATLDTAHDILLDEAGDLGSVA
jgi:hypothetical protein